jgi:hypothetical protein
MVSSSVILVSSVTIQVSSVIILVFATVVFALVLWKRLFSKTVFDVE